MKNNTPSIKELKQFALMMSWALPLFFYVVLPWLFDYSRHWWPFVASIIFIGLYLFAQTWILYPFRAWMFVSTKIGWVNTRLILGLTFYLMILPMGLVLRLLGKLQYKNKNQASQKSYYLIRDEKMKKEDLEKPF